jgi:hypothetical protein
MNTDIEFLKTIESDLEDVASRERIRLQRATLQGSIRRNTGRTWMKVVGVAAAFIVVAGVIGFVASGGGGDNEAAPAQAGRFQETGDAVAGVGGGPGFAPAPGEESFDQPSASPIPDAGARGAFGTQPQQQDLSKIIRDGRIGVVVQDGKFGDAVGDLTFIAEQHGGFVLSSSTQNERSGTFVLRIPEKRFDDAVDDVRRLGTVRFQEIKGDDVTAEFIDSQARLRILLARKALLFGLFRQADTTDEILRLAGQLDDVQLRIEQLQGQLRFLNDQVAESTLRVSIQERNAPEARTETEVDNPDLGSSFDLAVQGFLRIVGAVIVGLGYLIPLTVLGALVAMVVWFVRRRRGTA